MAADDGDAAAGVLARRLPPSRQVRRFLAASFVDSIGTGLYLAASALFFTRALGLSPAQVGLALSLAGVAGFLSAVPIGRLSDRVGARPTLVGLQVWRGACFLAYPFVDGVIPFIVVTCLAGVGEWGSAPVVQSLVGSLVARADAVRGMSALTLVRNIGFTASALAATVVIATGEVETYRGLVLVNAASFWSPRCCCCGWRPRSRYSAGARAGGRGHPARGPLPSRWRP